MSTDEADDLRNSRHIEEFSAYLTKKHIQYSHLAAFAYGSAYGSEYVYQMDVDPASALKYWEEIAYDEECGYWPILGECRAYWSQDMHFSHEKTNSLIAASLTIQPETWIANELASSTSPYHFGTHPLMIPLPLTYSVIKKYQKYAQLIPLTCLPTRMPWKAAAYLQFNVLDGPSAEIHTALWKRWYSIYGAVPVCIDCATVEFHVPTPPTTMRSAEALAIEHYAYCGDIIAQLAWSLENLKTILYQGSIWYFWWD